MWEGSGHYAEKMLEHLTRTGDFVVNRSKHDVNGASEPRAAKIMRPG